jgi:hypothetical protein
VDQAELDFLTQQNLKLMNLDPSMLNNTSDYIQQQHQQQQQMNQQHNSNSTNSFNMLKQQYYLQQQQYQDFTSFETIKKVLFNGNVGGGLGSNLSSSGVGPAGSAITPNGIMLAAPNSATNTLLNAYSSNSMQNRSSVDNESSQSSDMQAEAHLKIINEFKQKPFDELKNTLMKNSSDTYHDVFELISKEIEKDPLSQSGKHHGHHHHHSHHHHGPAVTSATSLTIANSDDKNVSHSSLSTNSNHSSSVATSGGSNAALLKEAYQQKITPLNDIEFPELFMYG